MRVYPADFRANAVRLSRELKSARLAGKRLGVYYQTIHRWVREHVDDPKWRCPCRPMQTLRGPACPACRQPAPPR